MSKAVSTFHKIPFCDGLEALATRNYNTAFPFHFHQTFNISLVYDGAFRAKIRGRDLHAPAGAILITNPLEIHANPCDNNESVSFFTFYISPDFFIHSAGNELIFFQENVIYDKALFNRLHRIAVQVEDGASSGRLEAALSHTLHDLSVKYAVSEYDNGSPVSNHSLFKDFLAGESFDKFSLERTARQFGINKYKFLRLFKFQTGLTPNNYFILKRIEKSKELLLEGQDLLSIATDLGFYDIPHFSKHFKKFTGISPSAYSLAIISAE